MNEPTKLQMFLGQIQSTASSESFGSVHSVTVRIPSVDFAAIEALSRTSGLARNKVIVNLIQVALEETWQALDPEIHDAVSGIQGVILRDLVQDNQGNVKVIDNAKPGEI